MQITPNIIYNVQLYKNANYKWASVIKMLEKSTRSLRSGREKQKAKSRKQKAIAIETKPRRTQKLTSTTCWDFLVAVFVFDIYENAGVRLFHNLFTFSFVLFRFPQSFN